MSASARKNNHNSDEIADNQNLLDFLKRKKKVNLQSTLNKSLNPHSHTKKKVEFDFDDQFPSFTEERSRQPVQFHSGKETSRAVRNAITPKKINFEDAQPRLSFQENHAGYGNAKSKSFLSMISPLKGERCVSVLEEKHDQKQNLPKSTAPKPKAESDRFNKRNVTKSINNIKQTVGVLHDQLSSIKDRSKGLTVGFAPIFKYLSDGKHPVSKLVGQLRNKLRSFEAHIDGVSTAQADQYIETFHKTLEEHLQAEEGELKKGIEYFREQELSKIRQGKQKIIEDLQLTNKKLTKDNEILQKKVSKLQYHAEGYQQALTDRQSSHNGQLEQLKYEYEGTIHTLKEKNQDLTISLERVLEENKRLQKEAKNERMLREEVTNRSQEENQRILQAKDEYLLNEIMVLKAEFHADMHRLNESHRIKEADLLVRLEEKDKEMRQRLEEAATFRQSEEKVIEENKKLREESLALKSKNDCIVTDMYRMNEELFQHWSALRDIKLLIGRMGYYSQVRKLYEDIRFNEHLFH